MLLGEAGTRHSHLRILIHLPYSTSNFTSLLGMRWATWSHDEEKHFPSTWQPFCFHVASLNLRASDGKFWPFLLPSSDWSVFGRFGPIFRILDALSGNPSLDTATMVDRQRNRVEDEVLIPVCRPSSQDPDSGHNHNPQPSVPQEAQANHNRQAMTMAAATTGSS
jgi:hypothetical protein